MKRTALTATLLGASALLASCAFAPRTGGPMGFFVTSSNPGKGGDLGGLAGADAYCQALASSAGAGGRTWRAYLSVPPKVAQAPAPWTPGVHARDRIGKGPWYNAKGVLVAANVEQLHKRNNITKETALDEKGRVIPGRGDQVNNHDILTGSRADGTALAPQPDTTCGGWTKSGEGAAVVGHHDRMGPTDEPWAKSWGFSHQTVGCSLDAFRRTGGAGLFYCFAAD